MPAGVEDGIVKGMYLFRECARECAGPQSAAHGLGAILREVIAAADLLRDDWGVPPISGA